MAKPQFKAPPDLVQHLVDHPDLVGDHTTGQFARMLQVQYKNLGFSPEDFSAIARDVHAELGRGGSLKPDALKEAFSRVAKLAEKARAEGKTPTEKTILSKIGKVYASLTGDEAPTSEALTEALAQLQNPSSPEAPKGKAPKAPKKGKTASTADETPTTASTAAPEVVPETPVADVVSGPPKKVQKGLSAVDKSKVRGRDNKAFREAKGRTDNWTGSPNRVSPTRGGPLALRSEQQAADAALQGSLKKGYLADLLHQGKVVGDVPLPGGGGVWRAGAAAAAPSAAEMILHPDLSNAARQAAAKLKAAAPKAAPVDIYEEMATSLRAAGKEVPKVEKMGLLKRGLNLAKNNKMATAMLALDALFLPGQIRELSGIDRGIELDTEMTRAKMARLQQPTAEDIIKQNEIQELVQRRQRLIETGDPGLAQLLMGMPETTRSEILIGGKPPDRQAFTDFVTKDVLSDGSANAVLSR